MVWNQGQGRHGDRLLTLHVLVLGDRLQQSMRSAGLDAPAVGQRLNLFPGQRLEQLEEAPRLRIQHVRARQRDEDGEGRVVDRELQRRQLRAHDERRHRLPGGHLLFLASLDQGVEKNLAGSSERFRDQPLAAPDRDLDRTGGIPRPGAVLADRGDEAAGGQDLSPLPRRQLARGDDEGFDLRRVRPEPM